MNLRVLLLEPDAARREWIGAGLREAGCAVDAPEPAVLPTERAELDVVVLAHALFVPGAIAPIHERDPLLPVVIATTHQPSAEGAVELGRAGAFDVVEVRARGDVAELSRRVVAAAERRAARLRPRRVAEDIAGSSDAVQQVRRYVDIAAGSDANVLIVGESGTGKELVARAIHRHGARAGGPFVAVNCSAIPEPLLESEMFGHERGSFTGAVGRAKGFFEQASGGTLLLDEIGELPLPLQSKLLRVLQPPPGAGATTREITRVGSEQPVRVDVRLLFATNRDLAAEVAAGRFREDLYQRLNVLSVRLPPLRDRASDIPHLARMFLEQHAAAAGRSGLWLDAATLDVLCAYSWPRNVRELELTMQSVVLVKEGGERGGPIVLGDLPRSVFAARGAEAAGDPAADGASPMRTLDAVAREHVERVLAHCGGNKSKASGVLGISRQSLDRRLNRWREGRTAEED